VPVGQQVADLGDGLELGKVLLVEIDVRRGHVLLEMLHRARTGNQQHPLVTGQQPASATCVAVMPCRSAAPDSRILRQLCLGPPLNAEPSAK
jgi:hypothetical protein